MDAIIECNAVQLPCNNEDNTDNINKQITIIIIISWLSLCAECIGVVQCKEELVVCWDKMSINLRN